MYAEKVTMRTNKINNDKTIKQTIAIDLRRLSPAQRILDDRKYTANNATVENIAEKQNGHQSEAQGINLCTLRLSVHLLPAPRKRGPIQDDSEYVIDRVLNTDVVEKENSAPQIKDPIIGSSSQTGIFDSLDF